MCTQFVHMGGTKFSNGSERTISFRRLCKFMHFLLSFNSMYPASSQPLFTLSSGPRQGLLHLPPQPLAMAGCLSKLVSQSSVKDNGADIAFSGPLLERARKL
jgi:hypothetical protein